MEIYVKIAFLIPQRCQAPERNFRGINIFVMVGVFFFCASTDKILYKASPRHTGFLIWERGHKKHELENWQNLIIKMVAIRNVIALQRSSGIA